MLEAALIFTLACIASALPSLTLAELRAVGKAVSEFFLGFTVGFLVLAAACTVGFWFYIVASALLS